MMNCELRQLNTFIKSCSTSNAAIKNTASPIPKEGWYPAYSASGQDVWLPEYRYSGKGIVVSAVGARCGKCFQADGKWNVTANTHVLLVDESIADYKYCWYLLNNENWWIKSGSGQPFVKVKDSLNRSILLPDLSTQQNIATILDKISEGIALCRRMLDELELMVKAKFGEMFGDMLLNSKHWSECTLESLADIVSGITKGRKTKDENLIEVPYMAVSNVKDGHIDWRTVKTIMATTQEINQYRLQSDDVLMTEGGDPDKVGRGAIIKNPPENCIHQNHIFRVRLNEKVILPTFFAEYLQHQKAKRYFLGCAKQTTGIASINMRQLKAMPVLLPPIELQEQFATFVSKTDKSRLTIQQVLSKMEMVKLALMHEYFG